MLVCSTYSLRSATRVSRTMQAEDNKTKILISMSKLVWGEGEGGGRGAERGRSMKWTGGREGGRKTGRGGSDRESVKIGAWNDFVT